MAWCDALLITLWYVLSLGHLRRIFYWNSTCTLVLINLLLIYRFAREWLIEGYSTVTDINSKEALTPEAKRALRGILQRHRNVVSRPSKTDLKFLSDQYSKFLDNIIMLSSKLRLSMHVRKLQTIN